MSIITSIYAALAAAPVTVNGVTPTAYTPDTLPASAETATLPCRVLDPFNVGDDGQYSFVAYGTTATVHWTIVDLMLWEQVGQTRGPLDVALSLAAYCGAYAEMLRTHRGIVPGGQAAIQQATPRIGVYEWPRGSTVMYYGVEVTLSIEEILSG